MKLYLCPVFLSLLLLTTVTNSQQIDCMVYSDWNCDCESKCVYKDFATVVNCACEETCHSFGDCCQDAENSTLTIYRPPDGSYECVRLPLRGYLLPHYVITSCPTSAGAGAESNFCENGLFLPVVSRQTGLLYKNQECAVCHEDLDVENLPVELRCNQLDDQHAWSEDLVQCLKLSTSFRCLISQSQCDVMFSLIINETIYSGTGCTPDVINTCPDGSEEAWKNNCENGITSYYYLVENGIERDRDVIYKNRDCARCNAGEYDQYKCKPPDTFNQNPKIADRDFTSLIRLPLLNCLAVNQGEPSQCDAHRCSNGREFVPLEGCVSTNSNNEAMTGNDTVAASNQAPTLSAKTILTIVLTVLSQVALVFHILLYVFIRQLRNRPAIITISLIVSLFVALTMYIASLFLENTKFCTTVAIIRHYSFLATFFWMNILAFDVVKMLTKIMQVKSRKSLIWYSLYGWICPLIIVVSAILSERYGGTIVPKYGGGECWLTDLYKGFILYLVAPLALMVGANIIMFIIAIVYTIKAARQTRMVNPNARDRFILALRLFFIMGLTWILGIVASFVKNEVLSYLFIILNGSQGLLITVSFVLSKNVRKQLLKCEPKRTQSGKSVGTNQLSVLSSKPA